MGREMKNHRSGSIKMAMIAPCGMNCALCIGHVREKNRCVGCWGEDPYKRASCTGCKIRNCDYFKRSKVKYCFGCEKYPCARLKQLDKRYRTKYGMSMIENLERIREVGIRKFVREEKERWACAECGRVVCVHREECLFCGRKKG